MTPIDKVLQAYNASSEFPETWDEEGDGALETLAVDDSQGELSRFALLKTLMSRRRAGSGDGGASGAQDEPDPLGSTDSVVSVLQARGVDVGDRETRSKYLVSSPDFSPQLFLRDVHREASYDNLRVALDYLESSIVNRSEDLRNLVERDYEHFVKSKQVLDTLLKQIDESGFNAEGGWGVSGLGRALEDASARATRVMKPVTDHRKREERLRSALTVIERHKQLFNLPSTLLRHVRNGDHDALVRDYRRGRDMRAQDEEAMADGPSEADLQNKRVVDRVWDEAESVVEDYRASLWRKLSHTDENHDYMQVISRLLDVGVVDNPILVWIDTQLEYYKKRMGEVIENLRVQMNLMAIGLAATPPSAEASLVTPVRDLAAAKHAKARAGSESGDENNPPGLVDAMDTVEMWIVLQTAVEELAELVVNLVRFWERCTDFLNGHGQRGLPPGYNGESRTHLEFSDVQTAEIRQYGHNVVAALVAQLTEFFSVRRPAPPPIANSDTASLPIASKFARDSRDNSPSVEDAYLFLPPHANALGTVRYTSRVFDLLASSFGEVAAAVDDQSVRQNIGKTLADVRARFADAAMHAWLADGRRFGHLEDWAVDAASPSCTNLPRLFQLYHEAVIDGLASLLFGPNGKRQPVTVGEEPRANIAAVLGSPSTTSIQQVLQTFSQAIGACLTSVVNHISTSSDLVSSNQSSHSAITTTTAATEELAPLDIKPDAKVLLTLSNILAIQSTLLKPLLLHAERAFNTGTREISIHLANVFGELETRLFALYTQGKRASLSEIIRDGFRTGRTAWRSTSTPTSISPYVYECLLNMVGVYAKVFDVSPSLVKRVIVVLYEHVLKTVLSSMREVESFGSGGALQVFADVDFFDSIMMHYKSAEAQNTVQNIHATLKTATTDPKLWQNRDGPRTYIQDIVRTALRKSHLNFLCFTETS